MHPPIPIFTARGRGRTTGADGAHYFTSRNRLNVASKPPSVAVAGLSEAG
jgi:hypothetical protein